ncbi:hypothetical protein BGZ83_000178 [Gryganskiella cystojenkinii]|nr:hypothetical protein BGZ83_000178 [Gryganskiella cystojenkinii]
MASSERGQSSSLTDTNDNPPEGRISNRPLNPPPQQQQQHPRYLHHHHSPDVDYYSRMDNVGPSQYPNNEINSNGISRRHQLLPPSSLSQSQHHHHHHLSGKNEDEDEELEVIGTGYSNTVEQEPKGRLPIVIPNLKYGPPDTSAQNFSPGTSLIFNAYRGHRNLLTQPYMAPEEEKAQPREQRRIQDGGDSIDQHDRSYQNSYYRQQQQPHQQRQQPQRPKQEQELSQQHHEHHSAPRNSYNRPPINPYPSGPPASDSVTQLSFQRRPIEHSTYRAPRDRQHHPYHDQGHLPDPRDTVDYRDHRDQRDFRGYREQIDRRDFDQSSPRTTTVGPGRQRSPSMRPTTHGQQQQQQRTPSPTRLAFHPESHRGNSAYQQQLRAHSDHVMQLPPMPQRLISDPGQGHGGSSLQPLLPQRSGSASQLHPNNSDYRSSEQQQRQQEQRRPMDYRVDQRRFDNPLPNVPPPFSGYSQPQPPSSFGRPRPEENWEHTASSSSPGFKHPYSPTPAIDIPRPRPRHQPPSHYPDDLDEPPEPLHSSSVPNQPSQPMFNGHHNNTTTIHNDAAAGADGPSGIRGVPFYQHAKPQFQQPRGPRYELSGVNFRMIFEYAGEVRECLLKGKVGTLDRLLYNAEILSKVFMGCRVDQDPNDLPEDETTLNPHQLRCTSCNIVKTPEWRKGPLVWGKMSRSKAALAAKSKALLQEAGASSSSTAPEGDSSSKPATNVEPEGGVGDQVIPSSSSPISAALTSRKRGRNSSPSDHYKDEDSDLDYENRLKPDEEEEEHDGEDQIANEIELPDNDDHRHPHPIQRRHDTDDDDEPNVESLQL